MNLTVSTHSCQNQLSSYYATHTKTEVRSIKLYHKWSILNYDLLYSISSNSSSESCNNCEFLSDNESQASLENISQTNEDFPKYFIKSSILKNDQVEFAMKLYPKGFNTKTKYQISLVLNLLDCAKLKQKNVEFECRISILVPDSNKDNSKKFNTKVINGKLIQGFECHLAEFISIDYLFKSKDLLLDSENTLTLHVEITYITDKILSTVTELPKEQFLQDPSSVNQLQFESLWKCPKFTDATLLIGEKEVRVHKLILATRSSVFALVFETQNDDEIRVSDDNSDENLDVWEMFLEYIYTGKLLLMDQFVEPLFILAKKYEINALKNRCEEYLCLRLSRDSIPELYKFAQEHDATQLRSSVLKYIKLRSQDIVQAMIRSKPESLMEMYNLTLNGCGKQKAIRQRKKVY